MSWYNNYLCLSLLHPIVSYLVHNASLLSKLKIMQYTLIVKAMVYTSNKISTALITTGQNKVMRGTQLPAELVREPQLPTRPAPLEEREEVADRTRVGHPCTVSYELTPAQNDETP